MIRLLLLTLFCAASGRAAPLDEARLLWAIAQVETGGIDRHGAAGERSIYQLTPAVWRQYQGTSRQRALAHLRWLASRVDNPTPYRVALVWNGGLGALRRPAASTRDYAQRVENLYLDAADR